MCWLISGADWGFLEKGFIWIKRARFADFINVLLNIQWKWNNLISLRPNYLVFIGYFKIHVCVVFKITASLRRFLWAPTTYVLLAPLETLAFTIKWWFCICPNSSIYLALLTFCIFVSSSPIIERVSIKRLSNKVALNLLLNIDMCNDTWSINKQPLGNRKYTNYNAIIIDKLWKDTICIVVIYNILEKKQLRN